MDIDRFANAIIRLGPGSGQLDIFAGDILYDGLDQSNAFTAGLIIVTALGHGHFASTVALLRIGSFQYGSLLLLGELQQINGGYYFICGRLDLSLRVWQDDASQQKGGN